MRPIKRNIRKELDLKLREKDSWGKQLDPLIVNRGIISR
jgi:hypothetical protein